MINWTSQTQTLTNCFSQILQKLWQTSTYSKWLHIKKTWNKDLLIPWHHWHLILTGLDMAQSRLHVLYLVNNGPISGSWEVWMDIWKLASWLAGSVSSIVHWGFQRLLPRVVIHWSWRFSPFKWWSWLLQWVETVQLKAHSSWMLSTVTMQTNPHLRSKGSRKLMQTLVE